MNCTTILRALVACVIWPSAQSHAVALTDDSPPVSVLQEYTFEAIPAYIPDWGAGYQGTYKPATGWKEPFVVSLEKDDPHFGQAAMKTQYGPELLDLVRVHSPGIRIPEALAGKTICVEAYVRSEGLPEGSVSLGILEKDPSGKTIGYVGRDATLAPIEGTSRWQKISAQGHLNTQTRTLVLMFTADTNAAGGTLYVDNILVLIPEEK